MIHLCITSNPAKLNQVFAVWVLGEAWSCLCAWRNPRLRWVTGLNCCWYHRVQSLKRGALWFSLLSSSYPTGHMPENHNFTRNIRKYLRSTNEISASHTLLWLCLYLWRQTVHHLLGSHPGSSWAGTNRGQVAWARLSLPGVRCRPHPP